MCSQNYDKNHDEIHNDLIVPQIVSSYSVTAVYICLYQSGVGEGWWVGARKSVVKKEPTQPTLFQVRFLDFK